MLTLLLFDYLGTFAFAVSGALKAVRKGMDLFGLLVLAVVTAIGGGTIRDALLGLRPFWLQDPTYLLLSVLAVGAVFALYRQISRHEQVLMWFDAVGLGTFTVIGAAKALDHGAGLPGAIIFACLTGVGGGMIRDVLAGDVPVVLRREVYASASILGALLYWTGREAGLAAPVLVPIVVVAVTAIRLLCLHFGIGLPKLVVKPASEVPPE